MHTVIHVVRKMEQGILLHYVLHIYVTQIYMHGLILHTPHLSP